MNAAPFGGLLGVLSAIPQSQPRYLVDSLTTQRCLQVLDWCHWIWQKQRRVQ